MHVQNFHYIAQANKNHLWNIIDIIITMLVNYKTFFIIKYGFIKLQN